MDNSNVDGGNFVNRSDSASNERDLRTLLEGIEDIRATLRNRINVNIPNNAQLATTLLKQLGELRSLLNADDQGLGLTRGVVRTNFVELIMSNVSTLLSYENVTDECLRILTPLTRVFSAGSSVALNASEEVLLLQREIMHQMFYSGGVVFALLALRGYMNSSLGIRALGLELLSAILEYIALTSDQKLPDSAVEGGEQHQLGDTLASIQPGDNHRPVSPGGTKYDYQGTDTVRYSGKDSGSCYGDASHHKRLRELVKLPSNPMTQDCVHQLLLHGAGIVLVRQLQYSTAAKSEINSRRSIWCLKFLLLETPPTLATKVANYDQFVCIYSLAKQLSATSKLARVEAAVLLTAMLSSDPKVCGVLTSVGGWDELSFVLAQNAEFAHMPPHWLQGSLENIKKLEAGNFGFTGSTRIPGVPTKGNNGADEVSAVETAVLTAAADGGGSFENILQSLLKNTNQSARERSRRWNRPNSRSGAKTSALTQSKSESVVGMKYARIPDVSADRALSTNNLHDVSQPNYATSNLASPERPRSRGDSFNIRNSKFAQHLRESPLGQPVDPAELRRVKRANGGKVPQHVPHALGGPKLGSRPGPDYGSKVKKKSVKGSGLGLTRRPGDSANKDSFGPLATADLLNPTPELTRDNSLENEKRNTIKVAKQANFIAKKLFETEAETEKPPAAAAAAGTSSQESAVEKLNFAERLQCMIMQVQELN